MKEIKRILIYRIGNLGDTVCAMPAMVAVRLRFPDAWIGLFTNKEGGNNPDSQNILKGNDFINEIITYKPENLHEIRYIYDVLKRLHKLQIDLLVYLGLSKSTRLRLLRDWLFFRLAGCRKLIGFKLPKSVSVLVYHGERLPVHPQEVERLMSLLAPLGIGDTEIDFRLPIKEDDKEAVDQVWEDYQLKTKYPIVAICPGGKYPAKRWAVDRFARVVLELQNQFNAKILLIGGPGEKALGDEIIKTTSNPIANLIGKTNYMQTAEVISRCNLLVSNDCGPVHLAAAVGTSVVGIYASIHFPGAWHPWGKQHRVLRDDSVSCRFCFKTECKTMACMNSITVGDVIAACRDYLK